MPNLRPISLRSCEPLIGGSHPLFSILSEELATAWQQPKIVLVDSLPDWDKLQASGEQLYKRRLMREGIQQFTEPTFQKIVRVDIQHGTPWQDVLNSLAAELKINPTQEQQTAAIQLLESYSHSTVGRIVDQAAPDAKTQVVDGATTDAIVPDSLK